jgi:hypothetical protein
MIAELNHPFADDPLTELLKRCPTAESNENFEIDLSVYRRLHAVLHTPFPKADIRTRLWDAIQHYDRVLQIQTDNNASRATVALGKFADERSDWERRETKRGLLRARLSFQLFKWGGLEEGKLEKARELYARVEREPNASPSWEALAQELKLLWSDSLAASMSQARDLTTKANLGRVMCPWDHDRAGGAEKSDRFPTAQQRIQQINAAKPFIQQLPD